MEQIAYQAIVMQLIMEMAKNCNMDSGGCFYLFFQKAKTIILKHSKMHLKLSSQESGFIFKCQVFTYEVQNHGPHFGGGSIGLLESKLPTVFYECSSLQFKLSTT